MQHVLFESKDVLDVSPDQVRRWFEELSTYPERYQFGTHAGFVFTSGAFGEIGARFRTEERFRGLPITLHFELTELGEASFTFRLVRPALPVWGSFLIGQTASGTASLALVVGEDAPRAAWFLRLPLVRSAIQRQISSEIAHIKSSVERVFSPPQP